MTPEEIVKNSYHMKVIMAALRQKYPYIIGYEFPENFNENWNKYDYNFFINLIVSKEKALEFRKNWELNWWVESYDEFDAVFLSLIFTTNELPGPKPTEDNTGIDNEMSKLADSKHIPREVKLPKQAGCSLFILKN